MLEPIPRSKPGLGFLGVTPGFGRISAWPNWLPKVLILPHPFPQNPHRKKPGVRVKPARSRSRDHVLVARQFFSLYIDRS